MLNKINDKLLKGFCIAMAMGITAPLHAQDADPNKGAEYLVQQGGTQLSFFVQFFLILGFAVGVIFIVIGGLGIPKIVKQQATEEDKKGVFIKMLTGAVLIVVPILIAFLTGILGGSEGSSAEAAREISTWGL